MLTSNVQWCQAQGIAGLDCWIVQSGLQSILLYWIVIDNPISKSGFGFGLSIQKFQFNPDPKNHYFYYLLLKFHRNFSKPSQILLIVLIKFGLNKSPLQRIWIGLTIQKSWIDQYPGQAIFGLGIVALDQGTCEIIP